MASSWSHHCSSSSNPLLNNPSSSSYFLCPKLHTHFPPLLKPLNLTLSCSQNTIQTDTHKPQNLNLDDDVQKKKKKRKPKPSFYQQIREKWSVKPISQCKKYPWQLQQQQEQEQEEKEEENDESLKLSGNLIDGSKNEGPTYGFGGNLEQSFHLSVSEPVNSELSSSFDVEKKNITEIKVVNNYHNNVNEKKYNAVNFGGSLAKNVVSKKLVDGKSDVEKNITKDDSKVALSSNTCDADSAKYKGVFVDNVAKDDSRVTLSANKCDDDSAKYKGFVVENVANVEVQEDSRVTLSSSKYDVEGGGGSYFRGKSGDRLPWVAEPDSEKAKGRSKTEVAEKTIPEHELKRLRNVALRMKERIKVGAAGVTQALVGDIHEKWKIDEVVKLKFEGPSMLNMRRIHDVLESKTGGLVIWRSGSSVVLYRGLTYKLDCVHTYVEEKKVDSDDSRNPGKRVPDSIGLQKKKSKEESMEIRELNNLLDELGPRFVDWSGPPPLPVDADLLPAVVPGYRTPFRLHPYGVRRALRDEETTHFRRTARITHPHFALGRSRELQGLAAAMVKLWEKSAIVKIAIKRGVLNTCNERMAEELKRLTGGTLLSRNKEYLVFYRGNDFLPPNVTESLKEREKLTVLQYQEEEARRNASALINSNFKTHKAPIVAGTLAETVAATSRWGKQQSSEDVERMIRDSAVARRASLVKYLQNKLAIANAKLKKAEMALEKVQGYLEPEELPTDLETITDEERLVFRKMGLSMKPHLLVGRREVFDGTIENIHLHWKFRELVKVIVKGKHFAQVKHLAISLEAESGGILVSIDKTTKGYAIIIYRGKNYRQPVRLRPKNLLTKRQALARSIELQRREGLKHHISSLHEQMELLKSELEDMKDGKEIDDKSFYEKLDDAAIPSDDEMEEDEDEEAYLQTYDSGDEDSEVYQDEN